MNKKISLSSIFKDNLILDTAIVFLGTTMAGFFNLLYHLVAVRLLITQDYGTFNALVSFMMFILMAVTPLGTTLTRYFTEYITKKDFAKLISTFIKVIKRLFYCAILIIFFFIIFSSPIGKFFKVRAVYITICGAVIFFSIFSLPLISLFQSFQRFKIYAGIGILSSLGKLVFGAFFMLVGLKVAGGLFGYLVSVIFILLISLYFAKNILYKEIKIFNLEKLSKPANLTPIFKYYFPVAIIMFSFTFLTNIDVVLVKRFFSPLNAGYYSVAQMVGKITLFLPSALAIVIFPKSTKAFVTNSSSLRILYKSFLIAGICCFFATLFSFAFPDFILRVLTGTTNPVSRNLVGLFALAMSFYALLWINVNYLIATHNLKFVVPILFFAIFEALFIYNYHSRLSNVLFILLFFGIASFLASLLALRKPGCSKTEV